MQGKTIKNKYYYFANEFVYFIYLAYSASIGHKQKTKKKKQRKTNKQHVTFVQVKLRQILIHRIVVIVNNQNKFG